MTSALLTPSPTAFTRTSPSPSQPVSLPQLRRTLSAASHRHTSHVGVELLRHWEKPRAPESRSPGRAFKTQPRLERVVRCVVMSEHRPCLSLQESQEVLSVLRDTANEVPLDWMRGTSSREGSVRRAASRRLALRMHDHERGERPVARDGVVVARRGENHLRSSHTRRQALRPEP